MEVNLTAGAVTKMLNGEVQSDKDLVPILQVIDLTLIRSKLKQNDDRYRVFFSDGINAQQGVLNTFLNVLVTRGNVQVGSIVKLIRFVSNPIGNRRIVIVMHMEVISEQCGMIGNHLHDSIGCGPVAVNTPSIDADGFEQQHERRMVILSSEFEKDFSI